MRRARWAALAVVCCQAEGEGWRGGGVFRGIGGEDGSDIGGGNAFREKLLQMGAQGRAGVIEEEAQRAAGFGQQHRVAQRLQGVGAQPLRCLHPGCEDADFDLLPDVVPGLRERLNRPQDFGAFGQPVGLIEPQREPDGGQRGCFPCIGRHLTLQVARQVGQRFPGLGRRADPQGQRIGDRHEVKHTAIQKELA